MYQERPAAVTARALLTLITLMAIGIACTVSAQPGRCPLKEGWALQSSAKIEASGDSISTTAFTPKDWYATEVPRTVLAVLADNGVYPDPYYGLNLKAIPGYQPGMWHVMKEDSPFYASWWYRKDFDAPAEWKGRHLSLHLDGINYAGMSG